MFADKNSGWRSTAWELCQNPCVKTVCAVVTHSMFLFSAGNNALAYGEATHAGFMLSLVGTAIITTMIAIGRKREDLPYRTLAAINFATAGLIGWEKHLSGSNDWLGPTTSAMCLIVWGIGHLWRGYLFPKKLEPQHIGENPLFYTGVADIIASVKSGLHNPWLFTATPFSLCGAVLTVRSNEAKTTEVRNINDFLHKHITPSRILATAYAVQTLMLHATRGPKYFMAATAAWALGFLPFDPKENKALIPDIKRLAGRKMRRSPPAPAA